eukprot:TRINITY_DN4039_c0_g1_i1.p1 TRINITY_DN4039_c0_g1~~TRINITY_DN4039_c0_g1_i1.p1  ORF type:complete len:713 (-),score=222.31 TRINITY_DN4039_c0_g1_i1:736-2874(-)
MSSTKCIQDGGFGACSSGDLLSLATLDGSSGGGVVSKTSWILLSRMGRDFLGLSGSGEDLFVCGSHFYKYFDAWSPPDGCVCGEKFIIKTERKVSLLLAVKVLQSEGRVLPIGSPLCESCWGKYERTYASKPGEKVMIILKKKRPLEIKKEETQEEVQDIKPDIVDLVDSDSPLEKCLRPDDDLVDTQDGPVESQHSSTFLPSFFRDSKFLCKLCNMSFSKESSYRLHKRTALDLHNRIKHRIRSQKKLKHIYDQGDDEWKCVDCFIAFKDAITLQKHLAEIHFTVHHPFHCRSCNFIFKSQSAFKSHNSRMHVNRINKVYYCRECDDTFACKHKHAQHILIHRPWNGDPNALQCKACGKVFAKQQTISYNKHIKYHNDAEFSESCSCYDCLEEDDSGEEGDGEGEDGEEELGILGQRKSLPLNKEDLSTPFQCSICPLKFGSPKELAQHVSDGVHEEGGMKAEEDPTDPLEFILPKKEEESAVDPFQFLEESMSEVDSTSLKIPEIKHEVKTEDIKPDVKPSIPTSEILYKMKLSFLSQSTQEADNSDSLSNNSDMDYSEDIQIYRNSTNSSKTYRGLPFDAYLKNNNVKSLLQRINNIAHLKGPRSGEDDQEEEHCFSSSSSSEGESDLEEEDPDKLLIPMENGWMCEKKWNEEEEAYSTLFWSPDGIQHSSLAIIKLYGQKKNLNLNMEHFHRAVENNPPPPPPTSQPS